MPKPTAERSLIVEAIQNVELDTSGEETTFTTVADIVNRWGHFKGDGGVPYHTMVIVVTDEVGDDQGRLEESGLARTAGQGAGLRFGIASDLRAC